MAYASDNADTATAAKQLSEKLKCPICLDVYNTPRYLACLHTFCEPCIHSLILRGQDKRAPPAGITCPVCRTETPSPCPGKPRSEWAEGLPVNDSIASMASDMGCQIKTVNCSVCQETERNVPAKYFCKECSLSQCEDCYNYHSRFPAFKSHHVISIDDLPTEITESFTLGKMEYCSKHPDTELEFYCENHKTLCCYKCQFHNHRFCKQVKEVSELGQRLKQMGRPQEIETEMDALQAGVGEIVRELENAESTMEKQSLDIPQRLKDTRNQLLQVFDRLVSDVTAECDQIYKQQTTELDDKITSMKSLEAAILTSRSLLEFLMKHGTEKQTFIVLQKLEEQVTLYRTELTETRRSVETVELRLTISKDLDKVLQAKQALASVTLVKKRQHQQQQMQQQLQREEELESEKEEIEVEARKQK